MGDVQCTVIVAELTLASARDVIRILSWLKSNAPQSQVIVVLNKVVAGATPEITKKDFEASIERKIDVVIPYDLKVTSQAAKGVVTTMIQTEKYGTPLASALRVLSAEFRNERMMRAEEKAARLPAIMTVPLILFRLPVLFIVILGPAACSISDNFVNRLG